ncbi:LytTR family DNA-binding domain-containing protein [Dyadobacter sp. CY343]|uniref:LytR/AlgR family response regulator transcription factor n=1 Tax=Dyadobacter sp. CY343 TaxID=2907299 RepID=UPI001F2EFB9B|nr:LytTR family DNA-binding domain-containing protein [Dyadobacter sp. CY343]MCE7063310.1 LytTR family DNA-binding domain-containing protein [Dyadobacter sp. CY343]
MMRAIIIDDEVNNIDNLRALLEKYCPEVDILGTALNADSAEELIARISPDLLFLDIQMPEKNGFELLKSLSNYHFEVIFVTGFDQYGIQAIRFSAIDYLLKPISHTELQAAVKRAEDKIGSKKQNAQLENLMKLLIDERRTTEHRIGLSSAKETRFVKTSEIVRCLAENNYTLFFLKDGEQILVSRPMFEFDELLSGYGFLRCHHSHLVNRAFIKSLIKEDSGYLLMEGGFKVPVSRLKKDYIRLALR